MIKIMTRLTGRRHFRSFILFIAGFAISIMLMFIANVDIESVSQNQLCADVEFKEDQTKGLVLIGIMTAAKYVDTRAYTVWKTWAQRIPGKVLFFVAEDTYSVHPEMPLIRLKGVDDSYPPQKKSFAMIRWMHDNYVSFSFLKY